MAKTSRIRIIKLAPPPAELPVYGRVDPAQVSFIGRTNYVAALEEKKFIFGIKRADRRRHVYMIGKSGVGKSKLIELMIRQDIAYGHGLCLVDPQGDIIETILDFIPQNRINDVCLIDPSDSRYPISFNPLANVEPGFKHQLTQGLIGVMEKQFGGNWTPRLEHLFRFACLALLDYPQATMRGMISMLTERDYRQRVAEYVGDEMVKRFWLTEFDNWSEKFDSEAVIPLVNKVNEFLSEPSLRNIFSQQENRIDFEELINNKKIILVNLAKGKIGEKNSSFFGSLFIIKIKQAGMARVALAESQRNDFYIYIEEFHNLFTETFESIMSEARKYGFCITIAHQYIDQLPQRVQASVLGNTGTIIVFRVAGDDALKLKSEMAPVFDVKDMINLGVQEFYIKMAINGETYDPFSAETLKVLPPPHRSYKTQIIEASRKNYAAAV